MAACGVEHAGQHGQCGSDEVHRSISSRSDRRFALDTERGFDTSGKSGAHRHHRENYTARAGKPAAGFFMPANGFCRKAVSICLIFLVAGSLKFDPSGKSLAESHHREKS
jgi:hypothetical protein